MVVRQEAVALAAVSGRAPDQFALDIRISKGALQRWTTIAVREQKASQRERRESELHEFDEGLLMRGSLDKPRAVPEPPWCSWCTRCTERQGRDGAASTADSQSKYPNSRSEHCSLMQTE
ncbi:MAG TPA: hypothetical protein VNN80_09170 [Polyangiaceae bacterium]|nr:hypothetical protein [Polyangiaceae bacterium]